MLESGDFIVDDTDFDNEDNVLDVELSGDFIVILILILKIMS